MSRFRLFLTALALLGIVLGTVARAGAEARVQEPAPSAPVIVETATAQPKPCAGHPAGARKCELPAILNLGVPLIAAALPDELPPVAAPRSVWRWSPRIEPRPPRLA